MLKKRFVAPITISVVFLAGTLTAFPQSLVTEKAISLPTAQAIAHAAIEKCRGNGFRVSVSVIDGSGVLKAFVRDDGTGPHTIDLSRRKAYTALTFKRTSAETAKAWAAAPPPPNIEGTVALAGGVPIKVGDQYIGAVGVSGAPGGEKDEVCAIAGIAKVADQLK